MPNVFDQGNIWQVTDDNGVSHNVDKSLLSPQMNQRMQGLVTPIPIEQQTAQNMGLNLPQPGQMPAATPVSMPQPNPAPVIPPAGQEFSAPAPDQPTAFAQVPAQVAGTQISQQSTGISPQGKAEIKNVQSDIKATEQEVKKSLDAQAEKDKAVQDEIFKAADTNMRLIDRFQQGEATRQAELDQQRAAYEQARETANNFEFKDFWASRGIGGTILAGLGMALGAYASAKGGGPNHAANIIDNAVREHSAQQRMQYEKAAKNVDLKGNVYQMALKQTGDARLAELTAMDAGYKQVEMKLNGFIQAAKSEQQKRDGLTLLANLQAKRADVAAMAADRQQTVVENKLTAPSIVPVDPSTGKQIPVPKFNNVNDYYTALDKAPGVKEWEQSKNYADRINSMAASGKLDNAILAEFIATGLKQGSFSDVMAKQISNQGLKSAAPDKIRRFLEGKPPKEFIDAVISEAAMDEQRKFNRVYPTLSAFDRAAGTLGVPAMLNGRRPQLSEDEIAKKAGATTVGTGK